MNRYRLLKRTIDLLVSSLLLVIGSPLIVVIGALVKRHDGGHVLYRAPRVGRHGRPFTMFKFRTMIVDADKLGSSSTASNDSRITPVGRWMRQHKFDELPQLINVLRGDMSLVGPRPQIAWDVNRYTAEERRLLDVAPGITDWASIRFRDEGAILAAEDDPDEAYDRLIRPEKIRLGLEYVDKMSLGTDISILLRTLGVVAARETSSRRFSRVTEKWDTVADDQQWCLAQERYSLAAELGTGKDVLEVGCGTGYGLAKIAPAARSTIGIDADEQNIESARRNAPEVDFRLGLAEKLDLANGCVDVVLALEMVYYVQDRQGLLAEAHRVLRPGGTLLLTLPNGARPGFHPSPFSTSYPDYRSIVQELVELGMGVQVFGSLPLANLDVRSDWMRRLAVAAHLVPRTLEGRSRLKRWLGRRMRPLKLIEPTSNGLLEKLPRIEDATTASRFGIWVVVGTRP